ncbi:MAG: hypothetical protein LAP38_14815 [Acidobacteriia bacterium]|nr:hypothetical protein [Terriglobia bacterium]
MLRFLVLAVFVVSSAGAAIWPEHLATYDRKSAAEVPATGLDEYGRDAAEEADYGAFKVQASRYKDTTGAYAASLESSEHPLLVGNYMITCSGKCPKNLASLADALPRISHAPMPLLKSYLPAKGMIAHSERYIMGPAGLHANLPQIRESAVALQFGTEGMTARYHSPKGELVLAVFSYPTPQIARQQTGPYEGIPGAAVKRTGPLVAVVLPPDNGAPADAAEAQKLLSQVNYQASVSWNEPLPLVIKPETAAKMVLGILTLAGIVLGFCLVSGLAFGLLRLVARRFGYSDAGTALTTLRLGGK